MKFSYRARNEQGDMESGVIEASSREAALDIIRGYGLYPTSLKVQREPFWTKEIPFISEVSQKNVIAFTRQLSILSGSDIPVVQALETIARQTRNEPFKEMIVKMAEEVEGGGSVSTALQRFKAIFSPFYIGMVRAGEKSGELPEALEYLADYLEKQRRLKNQFTGALLYPGFIMVVFFILLLLMSIFVVPNFETVFVDMGIEMPTMTKTVIGVSKVFRSFWWLMILGLVGSGFLIKFLLQREETKKVLDRFVLEVPVASGLLCLIYISRIALNLSTLVAGGVPISEALEITSEVVGNEVYKQIVLRAREQVRAGESLAATFASYPERFTPLFIQMATAGEKTGSLDTSLQGIVSFYDQEVERTLTGLLKFVEPGLIMFLGVLVVILGISLFLPLFQGGVLSV